MYMYIYHLAECSRDCAYIIKTFHYSYMYMYRYICVRVRVRVQLTVAKSVAM